ncbi:unnamed protein product [Allacma fusca]|uniref:PRA1 family protein n=1 Tax=Allacma fusca TaxID=39272 RepID=A0A8J2MCD1_9HEXA|nr:unnamed protein product [Allacma fusca]
MKVDGDIEAGPAAFQGIKLPLDGKIGVFLPPKLQLSRQLLIEWVAQARQNIRPWSVFCATGRFKAPASAQRLPRRVVKNVEYFQSNYLLVFGGLFLYCLTLSLLLDYVSFTAPGIHGPTWVILLDLHSQSRAVLFWVLGASCFLIVTHAAFYDIQNLLEPEDESFELTMEQVV